MNRQEKIQALVGDCVSKISGDEREIFREIADCAVALGYAPRQVKTSRGPSDTLAFVKSKVSRTLLKIRPDHPSRKLVLSFYATPVYSEVFSLGVKRVIEEFGGRYTGCYGCGRCKGAPQGYLYVYPDGKEVFRCGGELIELLPVGREHLDEIKAMMKNQDEFWMSQKTVREA